MGDADIFGWVGTTIGEELRVEAVAGEGGFGVVYRGTHLGLQVPIAIKCLKLPGGISGSQERKFLEQFRNEAQLLHRFSSRTTAIIRALDFGIATAPNGQQTPYMVMPWLRGESLADELHRRHMQDAPPRGLHAAIELLRPAADALAIAHDEEVSHLDIKPDNLFLAQYGHEQMLKVLDFGIAKLAHEATYLQLDGALTSLGTLNDKGHTIRAFTPRYAAPEQFDARYGDTGPWSDVYALALVLIEVASGKRALRGGNPRALMNASTDANNRPNLRDRGVHASAAVEAVLRRAVAIHADERYPHARTLWTALEQASREQSSHEPAARAHSGHEPASMDSPSASAKPTRDEPSPSIAWGQATVTAGPARQTDDDAAGMPMGQLQPGDVLRHDDQERFKLLSRIGAGGFATVWRARDQQSGELAAVKVPHGQLVRDRVRRERFFRGARAMAQLHHEAIVRVTVPHGEDGGFHYFAMKLIEGVDLQRAVLQRTIDRHAAVPLILKLGAGLSAAHRAGLVHRSIKPANILLDRDGAPKLVDFDLVTDTHTGGDTNTSTIDNIIYAAPEVLNRPQDADKRADVYALGMIALFVLRRATLPMDSLRGVGRLIADLDCDRRLKQVVARAVARDPAERYQRADDFCDALALAAADATASLAGAEPMDEEAVPDTVRESPTPQPLQPMAGAHATTVTAPTPAWASAHGEDRHGRWASFTIDGVEQRLRLIPAGTFVMGSPDDEEGRFEDEGPQHAVRIERAFWLADTPCTQAMWKAVMGTAPSAFQGEQRPVERVSHTDVQAFLRRLREHHPALHPRLPSEAEWEYACRAAFSWSLYALHDNRRPAERSLVAWYAANAGRTTRPVAQKAPNAWGLYDMLGNVWEWCADTLCDYAEMSDGGSGPTKEASGRRSAPLAVRGGCWANVARNVRAACRNAYPTRVALNQLGFRVAGSG